MLKPPRFPFLDQDQEFVIGIQKYGDDKTAHPITDIQRYGNDKGAFDLRDILLASAFSEQQWSVPSL